MHFSIQASDYSIEIGSLVDSSFSQFMYQNYSNSKKIIVTDENTNDYCLEYLLTSFDFLSNSEVVVLPAGEENKSLDVCSQVWESLAEYNLDRNSVIINLGGGVVTDMGGFIASLYKRGIDYINIPTSLLAMVDASVGGKTAVDLYSVKNLIGVFSNPKAVYIDIGFLSSLSEGELFAGFAEMLKHGLILSQNYWNELAGINNLANELTEFHVNTSVVIKNNIVLEDPYDKGLRKKLNFGHTIGHALESYFMIDDPISHGYAVALGMLAESFISFTRNFITLTEFTEIEEVICRNFLPIDLSMVDYEKLYSLLLKDKKNSEDKIKCVLLIAVGQCVIDQELTKQEIFNSLDYLHRIFLEKQNKLK
jgi:3-dehydroquinate synthase